MNEKEGAMGEERNTMITRGQIEQLSRLYQIDTFTILRAYLQLVFLNYFYQQEEAQSIVFRGGTAIKLFFGSPRFSEDLDFSTTHSPSQINSTLKITEKALAKEVPSLRIHHLHSGKATERFRVRYEGEETKYPMVIGLDFHRANEVGETTLSSLTTRFPVVIFPLIPHLTAEAILKEKLEALQARDKGRDFFDVWYLLERGIPLPKGFDKEIVLKKIRALSPKKLKQDLSAFLPKNQRKNIPTLKERLRGYFIS